MHSKKARSTKAVDLRVTSAFSHFGAHIDAPYFPGIAETTCGAMDSSLIDACIGDDHDSKVVIFGRLTGRVRAKNVSFFDPPHLSSGRDFLHRWKIDNWCLDVQPELETLWSPGAIWALSSSFLAALLDPRPFLAAVKRISLEKGLSLLFVHTDDKAAARGWSPEGFLSFLEKSGFNPAALPLDSITTPAYIASLTRESYGNYLHRLGFSPEILDAKWLLLATTSGTDGIASGLDTYVHSIKALDRNAAVLMCDPDATAMPADGRTLMPRMFARMDNESFFDGLGLVEVIRSILYLLPEIKLLESQDRGSIFFRVVQAKRTGVLPQWLHLRLFLHGSIDYLKYTTAGEAAMNYSPHEASLAIRDHYVFKNVDSCRAPSRFIAELLSREFRHQFPEISITPPPYDLHRLPPAAPGEFGPISRIVFIGSHEATEWKDFVEALDTLSRASRLSNITEIVSIGPSFPTINDREKLESIARYRKIRLAHTEAIRFVHEHIGDSLFLPLSSDGSCAYAVLEHLLIGSRFVAYTWGGTVETIDVATLASDYFSAPDPTSLADRISHVLSLSPVAHGAVISRLRSSARARQETINAWWAGGQKEDWPRRTARAHTLTAPDITIAIPVFNTTLSYIEELLHSLLTSRLRPRRVLVIDDGSEPAYSEQLGACVSAMAGDRLNVEIHRQANAGLAGARNTGMQLSDSIFTFFIDSDDLVLPHTLEESWTALNLDPDLVAVIGFGINFADLKTLPKTPEPLVDGWFWKPLGIPEARSLSTLVNQFIPASVLTRTELLRQTGGWDASDKTTWEDWAFYARLAWSGKRFSIMPSPGYLYRNTPGSMSKTGNRYLGRRRLVRNLASMSRLDANVLLSLVNQGGTQDQLSGATTTLSEKEAELINAIRRLAQRPWLRRSMVMAFRLAARFRRMWT